MPYNLLNCAGWVEERSGWFTGGACLKARVGIIILFFILAILRKWGGEELGIGFSFLFALICGLLPYFIIIFIFGHFGWAFLIGLIGGILGGYGAGMFFGEEGY